MASATFDAEIDRASAWKRSAETRPPTIQASSGFSGSLFAAAVFAGAFFVDAPLGVFSVVAGVLEGWRKQYGWVNRR